MSRNACKTCEWWENAKSSYTGENIPGIGDCHRYPSTMSCRSSHWCGEWQESEYAKKARETKETAEKERAYNEKLERLKQSIERENQIPGVNWWPQW